MPALAQLDCVPFFPRRWWCVGGAWWLLVGGACLERSVMFQAVSELVWPKEVYRVDLEQHMCLELFQVTRHVSVVRYCWCASYTVVYRDCRSAHGLNIR